MGISEADTAFLLYSLYELNSLDLNRIRISGLSVDLTTGKNKAVTFFQAENFLCELNTMIKQSKIDVIRLFMTKLLSIICEAVFSYTPSCSLA